MTLFRSMIFWILDWSMKYTKGVIPANVVLFNVAVDVTFGSTTAGVNMLVLNKDIFGEPSLFLDGPHRPSSLLILDASTSSASGSQSSPSTFCNALFNDCSCSIYAPQIGLSAIRELGLG